MATVAYIRVSTSEQNDARQTEALSQADRQFIDRASGKDTHRPELDKLLAYVREGDKVLVHSMDRLARNVDDLRRLVQTLNKKGVQVDFIKEGLSFNGADTPMAQLMLSVLGAFAEFERALIKERQLEGIAIAKANGLYKGRKRSLTDQQISEIRNSSEPKAELARRYGISRETLYQYLRNS